MEDISLPDSVPVITLAHCNLLPHGLLPLYIFEPRYRQMLDYALEQNRFLCVSTRLPDAREDDDDAIFRHSTAGLVRACVRADDGASNLILQGIQRVEFGELLQELPFRIVAIKPVPTRNSEPERAERLRRKLLEILTRLETGNPDFLRQLREVPAPDDLADVLAFHLISDSYARQPLLEMEDISDRLEFLLKAFASV